MDKTIIGVALGLGAATGLAYFANRAINKDAPLLENKEPEPVTLDEAIKNVADAAKKLGAFSAPKEEEETKIPSFSNSETKVTPPLEVVK
jgi:hypothetical protein